MFNYSRSDFGLHRNDAGYSSVNILPQKREMRIAHQQFAERCLLSENRLLILLDWAENGISETLPVVTATVAALGVSSHMACSDLSNIQALHRKVWFIYSTLQYWHLSLFRLLIFFPAFFSDACKDNF